MRIAVLGAGIMGSSVALGLARRGVAVSLFDAAPEPFSGASRWNEGKIHLGFLYAADPSLATARHILTGGLLFRPVVERLLDCSLSPVITPSDDIFLCHRDSVVGVEAMQAYYERLAPMVAAHPEAANYLVDVTACRSRRLSGRELLELSGAPEIRAGFMVPERSVSTVWIAQRYVECLRAQPGIELRMNTRVAGASCVGDDPQGQWVVETEDGQRDGPYDFVVNALWNGRIAVDRCAGLPPPAVWSQRYRLALFLRTSRPLEVPSVLVATGPFGDIKNYDGRNFYLSWYPAGLLLDSAEIDPVRPVHPAGPDRRRFADAMMDALQQCVSAVGQIRQELESVRVEGGWVFASGRGVLSDPKSSLHRRNEFGVTRSGRYLSVDTGKYSTAPWMALELVEQLLAS